MSKNCFKRMKKSSIALMLGFTLLGSGISVYGATYASGREYEFEDAFIGVRDEIREIDVRWKMHTDTTISYLKITGSNCPAAQTAFRVRDVESNAVMSPDILYIYGTDSSVHKFEYRSQWIDGRYEVRLEAWPTSGYSGYTVDGVWAPDGI